MSTPPWLDDTTPGLAGWRLMEDTAIANALRLQEWQVWTTRTARDPNPNPDDPPWTRLDPLLADEAVPLDGADWNHITPHRAVDGDTVRLWRSQVSWHLAGEHKSIRGQITTRWGVRVVHDDPARLPGGQAGRLLNLDTPERGQPGYDLARAELWAWITGHADRVRCITYDMGGGFDRLLLDLYVLGQDGRIEDTASQWMLLHGNNGAGWRPYLTENMRRAARHG